jgi:signal transduction histidine kinase
MRSLFLKFLVSFWLVIGLIIGAAAIGGFLYAEQLQRTIEDFEIGGSMQVASAALENGGRKGLEEWRDSTPRDDGVGILILDSEGRDISGRRIPFAAERMFERHKARLERYRRSGDVDGDGNFRRSRFLPQLTGPDGRVYTMLVAPVRAPEAFWSNQDIRVLLFVFALLTSGLVSYGLASAFSRPVRKLRDATVELAEGNLDIRVAESMGNRKDELGMLGHDFDAMAEKLQRAAERQIELTRNISHELRSPLARMRVAVELARRKAGEMPEFQRLEDDAERLDSLIGQILSYTKLDAEAEKEPSPFDLPDVLNEVAENVNFECGDDRVTVTGADTRTEIRGYRGALASAVENVVRNAVRHGSGNGGVTIRTVAGDGNVVIEVIDDGPGVAGEDLARLFEPFFRTRDSAENDGNGGTGLGLAIARRAVELHQGRIEAMNGENGGFVVRITLPLNPSTSSQ